MRRTLRLIPLVLLAGCTSLTGTTDNSGFLYATLRGTVTRANGTPVPNVEVGVSCVGASNDPVGFTTDATATGAFEVALNMPSIFSPLEGPSFVCRVLTPVTGLPLAERSVTVVVGSNRNARPVTTVSLVVP
ncbi:hypothetical protein [Gemmatimonas sp.]|jgi:hypothetical protein|uniref:hypothetical protein n=1 Tax=Gemmatimonas sp. TaxID=1962908 RepID=UPI00391F6D13